MISRKMKTTISFVGWTIAKKKHKEESENRVYEKYRVEGMANINNQRL